MSAAAAGLVVAAIRYMYLEIPQLKSMGNTPFGRLSEINVAFVCISKNKPCNPYPVILYKIVGSPPPHLGKKSGSATGAGLVVGDIRSLHATHASGNPPTEINGKYSFWPFLCN